MRSRFLLGSLLGLIAVCLGCNIGIGDGRFLDEVPCDAGLDAAALELLDGGVFDAGFCEVPENNGAVDLDDAGGTPAFDAEVECAPLITATCGPLGECAQDPACVAADLLLRFEPERCAAALGDARSFPPCTQGACDRLVDKVCATACVDVPACTPAQTLQERSDDGDLSAETSCGSALSDESLFPPCGS